MENYKLLNTVSRLEKEVDNLTKEIYTLNQQMSDMIEQIKFLKEKNQDDGK